MGASMELPPHQMLESSPSLKEHGSPAAPPAVDSSLDLHDTNIWTPPVYCTNCTCPLDRDVSLCEECGHDRANDSLLFSHPTTTPNTTLASTWSHPAVLAYDDRMTLHEEDVPHSSHPERPDRVRAIMATLSSPSLESRYRRINVREATREEIEACHSSHLFDTVDNATKAADLGVTAMQLKSDTYVNRHTMLCARLAAGACVDTALAVYKGEAPSGCAICRPPGHHAESNTAMGFCFFNNAAVAARAVQKAGAQKVLILDIDVHHGNGTQEIFQDDPSVLYMSIHRHDGGAFYPGTGSPYAVGGGDAKGTSVNVGWPCGGMNNADYMAAMHHVIMPISHEFSPDLIIISAGFDAADGDPIGGCHLTPEIYAHITYMMQSVSPTIAILEGGYNLQATASCSEAMMKVLVGDRPPQLPRDAGHEVSSAAMHAVAVALNVQSKYWSCLHSLTMPLSRLYVSQSSSMMAVKNTSRYQYYYGHHGSDDDHMHECLYDDSCEWYTTAVNNNDDNDDYGCGDDDNDDYGCGDDNDDTNNEYFVDRRSLPGSITLNTATTTPATTNILHHSSSGDDDHVVDGGVYDEEGCMMNACMNDDDDDDDIDGRVVVKKEYGGFVYE